MTGPILVTGGTGQLASALAPRCRISRVGRPAFDFDRPETIEAAFAAAAPRLVVNAAAYTAVDAAESDAEAAYRANRDGPAVLARLCAEADIPLIHVSTDYVFDGTKANPTSRPTRSRRKASTAPANWPASRPCCASGAKAIMLRTAWVYAATGRNFVRTMLTVGKTRARLTVVADQHGCPTAAADLADAILAIIARIDATGWQAGLSRRFPRCRHRRDHLVRSRGRDVRGGRPARRQRARVVPIATADWPTPAKRPANSRLDCARLRDVFGVRLPEWRASLARTVETIFTTAPP